MKLSILAMLLLQIGWSTVGVSEERLILGVSAPLTGEMAEYGAAVRNGLLMAAEEDPKTADRVRLILEDNRYDAAEAISVFNRLSTIHGAGLIFSWGEAPLGSVAPLAERNKLPLLAMSADPRPGLGRKFVIRTINHTQQIAAALMEHLRKRGLRRLGLIQTDDPFYESMAQSLRGALHPGESLTILQTVLAGEKDFRSTVVRIKQTSIDALGVYLMPGQISLFFRQAASSRLNLPAFGYDGFESRKEIGDAQGAMRGAVYVNLAVPETFTAAYLNRFGQDYQIAFAYNAYQTLRLVQQELGTLVYRSPEAILDGLMNPADPARWPFKVKESRDGGRYFEFPLVARRVTEDWVEDISSS